MRREILLVVLLVTATAAVAAWWVVDDYLARKPQPRPVLLAPPPPVPDPRSVANEPASSAPAVPAPVVSHVEAPRPQPVGDQPRGRAAPQPPKRTYQRPPQPSTPITREVAREALALVGADPVAEEVWNRAINDPDMPPNVRSDLIEDLNEHGFPDPRNLTADDLPLIVNRLALIERLAPDAMDQVNAAAFQEAYKDLVNMYNRLAGQ